MFIGYGVGAAERRWDWGQEEILGKELQASILATHFDLPTTLQIGTVASGKRKECMEFTLICLL